MISLLYLGRVDYGEALALQQELTERRKRGLLGDVLLLLEHPPVLTMGRNAHREHILATEALLKERGIAIFETNRGGDVTYHGPGQLVGYPILDLRGFTPSLGAIEYVRKLEEVLLRACGDYGILTGRIPGAPAYGQIGRREAGSGKEDRGHWRAHLPRRYLARLRVNVTSGLDDFQMIVPCGISDRGVTSIEAEIDERIHPTPTLEQDGQLHRPPFCAGICATGSVGRILGGATGRGATRGTGRSGAHGNALESESLFGRNGERKSMPTEVIMPQMGESIFEGTITKWLKKPGDTVQRDEPLFEISTDKVDAEIPSPASGILTEVKIGEGSTVTGQYGRCPDRGIEWSNGFPSRPAESRPCGRHPRRAPRRKRNRRRPRRLPQPAPAAPAPPRPLPRSTSSCRRWASRSLRARSPSG